VADRDTEHERGGRGRRRPVAILGVSSERRAWGAAPASSAVEACRAAGHRPARAPITGIFPGARVA